MEELSGFNYMLGRPQIQQLEIDAALNEIPGVNIAPRGLLALIRAHQPVTAVDDDRTPPPADTETSIVAALRSRLIAKDTQVVELKAQLRQRDQTIAVLHGELEKLIATSPQGHQ